MTIPTSLRDSERDGFVTGMDVFAASDITKVRKEFAGLSKQEGRRKKTKMPSFSGISMCRSSGKW